jgi:hypothetical protein
MRPRFPAEPTPTATAATPTFQAPTAPVQDPRIKALTDALSVQYQHTTDPRINDTIGKLNTTRDAAINVGDVSTDAEAAAYRIARKREAEQQRNVEADRLGASGVTGSGDFDTRVSGINEQVGQDVGSFNAALAGRKRTELLNERNSQTASLQQLLSSLMDQDRTAIATEEGARADQQSLLNSLLGAQNADRSDARAGNAQQIEAARLAMEQEQFRRSMQAQYGSTPAPVTYPMPKYQFA